MSSLNKDLARAVERRNHDQLAKAAHEVGHGLGEIAGGGRPHFVRLNFGIFGGFHGGVCEWDSWADDWSRKRAEGRLIALMAGHAAETRFCQLYLGLDFKAAYRWGKEDCVNDYWIFKYGRRKFGLKIRPERAFDIAMGLINDKAGRLDELTVRLERAHYLPGGTL